MSYESVKRKDLWKRDRCDIGVRAKTRVKVWVNVIRVRV